MKDNHQPLLSICIPIYNRKDYLVRMFERFITDKQIIRDNVEIIVSDNCSEDNLNFVCNKYKSDGLPISYFRNDENIGSNRNFICCLKRARGKYTVLHGSDDIPSTNYFNILLPLLNENYGLIVLKNTQNITPIIKVAKNTNEFIVNNSLLLSFMSSNIFRTDIINQYDFSNFVFTWLVQMPYYITAAYSSERNVTVYFNYLQEDNDSKNNGGYNYFKVFCENFLFIYKYFVNKNYLNVKSYEKIKYHLLNEFLLDYYIDLCILNKTSRLDVKGGTIILLKKYWKCPYFYKLFLKKIVNRLKEKI